MISSSTAKCRVMGILNCTPDSFYDGSPGDTNAFVEKALNMETLGADIIDIGGESTRPGAEKIELEEELRRVLPVVKKLRQSSNICLSIDTSKAQVAQACLDAGVNIVNDVTAGSDPLMPKVVAQHHCDVILMHMCGTPKTMQNAPKYEHVLQEVQHYLLERSKVFCEAGVARKNIIWDPGIGFGKNGEHNLTLMANLKFFSGGYRLLLGTSRKSFIAAIDPEAKMPKDRLGGSLASLSLALLQGVNMVRVHDVRETRQYITVFQQLQRHLIP